MLVLSFKVDTHTNTLSPKMYFVPYLSLKIHIIHTVVYNINKTKISFQ